MKILMINKFFYPRGGSEKYMFQLRDLLTSQGHQVVDFAMADENNLPSKFSQYFIKPIDFNQRQGLFKDIGKAGHLLYSVEASRQLKKLIEVEKPDLAHIHNFNFQLTPSILRVLKKAQIPVVWTMHDYKYICPNYRLFTQGQICERCKKSKYYNCAKYKCFKNQFSFSFLAMLEMYLHKLVLRSYQAVTVFISPSKFLQTKVIDWTGQSNIKQLYNFIDLSQFQPQTSEGQGIVYVGRLSPEKGVQVLLKAMQTLPELTLQIIGAGPQKQEITDYIKKNKLTNVKLTGYKSGSQLYQLINQSKIVIMPSLWYENNPLSILEAFALGKPVIGANLGGIPELVQDNLTGSLFTPGDSQDLAAKIKQLYFNPVLAKKMGQTARTWVENNCNQSQHYQQLVQIYQNILK